MAYLNLRIKQLKALLFVSTATTCGRLWKGGVQAYSDSVSLSNGNLHCVEDTMGNAFWVTESHIQTRQWHWPASVSDVIVFLKATRETRTTYIVYITWNDFTDFIIGTVFILLVTFKLIRQSSATMGTALRFKPSDSFVQNSKAKAQLMQLPK